MTGAAGEQTAFLAFIAQPGSDSLIGLLRAHQGRIFRLCYQVLHNAEDAEDASQEVLLKIVDEIRQFADPVSFRRWLNRVSLNAALEAARKAARRRAHETRAAMQQLVPTPLDAATRLALFEAIAALGEGPRNLVLDHYFEGESLESIGQREGCSAPAVCKKLDDARESLRRRLGASVAIPSLESLFPAAPAAPDLVTGVVLAQAKAAAAALVAGGAIMSTKATIAAIALTAILCLTVGTGFGVLLKRGSERTTRQRIDELEHRLADAVKSKTVASKSTQLPSPPATEPVKTALEPAESPLNARLNRWKAWKDAARREREEFRGKLDSDKLTAYLTRKNREQVTELDGVFQLAFDDPETFLAFIRAPENEPYLEGFLLNALGFSRLEPGFIMVRALDFKHFPEALTDGLFELVKTGSTAQRAAALAFFGRLSGSPPEYAEYFRSFLKSPEPGLQIEAIGVMTSMGPPTGENLEAIIALGAKSPHEAVRARVADALRYVDQPEATAYLFERLESPRDLKELVSATMALGHKLMMAARTGGSPVSEERFLTAISTHWSRGYDESVFKMMLYNVVCCPGDKVRPVLAGALASAPTDKTKEIVAEILRRMDEGEKDREALKGLIYKSAK
jgi:RNA polymerase sigma-70 factor (ECF subfamily)